jgi:predicted metalloprotease with PDZ domain
VQESVALGAPDLEIATRRVDGAPVRVAWRGRWAFSVAALVDSVADVSGALHRYWGDPMRPLFVAVAPLVPGADGSHSIYGRHRGDAFSLAATTNANVPAERRLLTHELAHAWVPDALGGFAASDEARDYWFTEGLADFVAARALVRAGLWSSERFAADLDTVLHRHGTSPARALPNAEAAARHWRDADVRQLAYDRGHLLAHVLDHEVRAGSGGRAGLDDVLRAQRRAAARDARRGVRVPAAARFPAAVRTRTGVDVRAVLARHVDRGEPVWLPAALFGTCAHVDSVVGPTFDRGYDAAATRAAGGVAAGVDSAGPAWGAGLRDGMRVVRREAGVVGDPAVRFALRVRDGAREWTLSYLPASARQLTWQRVALAQPRDPARRAACAARLGGR